MTETANTTKATRKETLDIISLQQFNDQIPDEAAAIAFAEGQRWGDAPYCPRCGQEDTAYRVKSNKPMSHRCRSCKKYFSVRTNTVMAETNLPVRTWLLAIHLIHGARKGMSAVQLHKLLGVDYRTAWFLGHRIREGMAAKLGDALLDGPVEIDETYFGGKEKNKHASKRAKNRGLSSKFPVVGLLSRGGRIVASPMRHINVVTLERAVMGNVKPGSTVYTDGHSGYAYLKYRGYEHESVNHTAGEYVNGMASTNGIESFWALMKRGYIGTFHQMSWKHLHRYVNEFAYRHNAGPGNGLRTIGMSIKDMEGKRVTLKELVAKE